MLGLIDPKNEAMGSLRKVLDGVSARLTGLSGVNRQELVAAAHTVIAVVSVFEVYREHVGPRFDELGVTDREKFRALGVEPAAGRKEVHQLPALAALRVPAPGATRGFRENLDAELVPFFARANEMVVNFLSGLRIGVSAPPPTGEMYERYVSHYLGLAAEIPEFGVWALIGEHSATRTEVRTAGAAVLDALAVPSVERGFVAPAYRLVVHDDDCAPSSERWWRENTRVGEDIDAFFAAHLASPDSTTLPLLVLGHPGAGKSLLMSVLAARMPALGYAVVNVQLRRVDAGDPVVRQVETALEECSRSGWTGAGST